MSEDVQAQLDEFARQLAALTAKFEQLQRQAGTGPAQAPRPASAYGLATPEPRTAAPLQPFPRPSTAPPAAARPAAAAPSRPRAPRPPRPKLELDLLGPRALAIAGGIVTLLGIVFFFVLAVNRGWIGPNARVALGAIAATLVFGSGLELKRR